MGKAGIVVTDRDIRIFELINKFGWIREDYLAKYLQLDWQDRQARNILKTLAYRLTKGDYIVKKKVIAGYPSYWALAKNGAAFIGGLVIKDIVLMLLKHNDLVAELAIDFIIKEPELFLVTETELKRELYGIEAKKKKLPDLVINDSIAVEIEISKKEDIRLSNIIAGYDNGPYTQVMYYTNSCSIADRVHKLSNGNTKFSYYLFSGLDILQAKPYNPAATDIVENVLPNSGQYQSQYARRLKDIGFFDSIVKED